MRPHPHNASYTTIKGAVIMLTKALAIEWAPFNNRANCIFPILTDASLQGIYFEIKKILH
ncbi:MAG: SDR family oxidoreductase [Dethiobacteria bacterium]